MLRLLVTLATASTLVVRDGAELKAALANGAPAIELAADTYLGGTPAVMTSAASIDGKGHTVSQAGALHFLSDAVVVDSGTFWRSHRGRGTGDR